jgi:phosphatidylserine decarboxylase
MTDPFAALQRVLPQHLISRLAGHLTSSTHPWISRTLIDLARRTYGISLADAALPSPADYRSFDEFFTRALAPGARPLPDDPQLLVSPADGTISQAGLIERGRLMQAKGVTYSLESLLTDGTLARQLDGGWFGTIYLAPADYHRVHLPLDATLVRTTAIPGALFSVNARTEAAILDLFCRNERLVCCFETSFGPFVVVLVGALIVASIETVWDGPASPYRARSERRYRLALTRGSEIGRFKMGSTVIVLTPRGAFAPTAARPGQRVRVNEALGRIVAGTATSRGTAPAGDTDDNDVTPGPR